MNFHWFMQKDFTSFDGVEASVFPPSEGARSKFGESCEWAIHTRTRASASSGDRHQQNETIRAARKKFGGDFYNDWHGTNRYIPVAELDELSPFARGLSMVYERTKQSLKAIRAVLPHPLEAFAKMEGTPLEAIAVMDPTRVLYNALVPFAVAALEHFFGQAFTILLQYDDKAKIKLSQSTRKIDISDMLAVSAGAKSIESVVADWYSFQNIESIHRAFSEWFGIDFWKLLRQKRKVGNRINWLEKRFTALIEFRHGIVHRFEVDPELTRQDVDQIFELCERIIDVFVHHIETVRDEQIRHWI